VEIEKLDIAASYTEQAAARLQDNRVTLQDIGPNLTAGGSIDELEDLQEVQFSIEAEARSLRQYADWLEYEVLPQVQGEVRVVVGAMNRYAEAP